MALVEVEDGLALPTIEPVISGDPTVVLVGLAVALAPTVELAVRDAEPADEGGYGDLGLLGPDADEVDDLVA